MPCTGPNSENKFYGKYRGKVEENIDPEGLGRIIPSVPAVSGSKLNWAMPCTPYAGRDVGFYAIPPIGASVWIEFEGGDPNFPIWAGCFWGPEDVMLEVTPETPLPLPEVKVFKTEFVTMFMNDMPEVGGFTLKCKPAAVDIPLTMTFNSTGITLLCPESMIKMTPESITVTVPESVMEMTAETTMITVPPSVLSLSAEEASLAIPASSLVMTEAAMEMESPEFNVTAVVTVEGETNVTPALTVEGETNCAGALTVEGETNCALAVTAEGEVNVAGALTSEGEVNIAGACTVEGAILEDGMPVMVVPV